MTAPIPRAVLVDLIARWEAEADELDRRADAIESTATSLGAVPPARLLTLSGCATGIRTVTTGLRAMLKLIPGEEVMTMPIADVLPLVYHSRDGAESIVPLRFRARAWLAGLALAALLLACAGCGEGTVRGADRQPVGESFGALKYGQGARAGNVLLVRIQELEARVSALEAAQAGKESK